MKKTVVCIFLTFLCIPLTASVKCMTNSKNLTEEIDYKEWYPVACSCPCQVTRNGYCTECRHLQNASTDIVVEPTKVANNQELPKLQIADNPYAVIKKLALDYLQQKKD